MLSTHRFPPASNGGSVIQEDGRPHVCAACFAACLCTLQDCGRRGRSRGMRVCLIGRLSAHRRDQTCLPHSGSWTVRRSPGGPRATTRDCTQCVEPPPRRCALPYGEGYEPDARRRRRGGGHPPAPPRLLRWPAGRFAAPADVVTAAAYWGTGKLGLLLAIPPGYATAVWPPSGLALAAVLVCGTRVWPGIVLGSVLVNLPTSFDASTVGALCLSLGRAVSIGGGAALQAVVGAVLIRRVVGFPHPLDREKDVGRFLLLGGPLSCLLNATLGVTALAVSGLIPWTMAFLSWWTWWVGDTIGVLIVTPLVLSWTAEPRQVWRLRRRGMALPLALVFGLAVAFFVYASARERSRLQSALERHASPLAQALQHRLHTSLNLLYALESLYATTPEVTRREFGTFVHRVFTRYPGLQALSWDRRVTDAERPAYEAQVRQEGDADFHITEWDAQGHRVRAAPRAGYVVVSYIEPLVGNEQAVGFDVASEPERRAALEQARDLGEPIATGRVRLVQGSGGHGGMLIFQPVYRPGLPHATVAERRAHLRGYLTGVFRIGDMVDAALEGYDRTHITLRIDDQTAPADRRLLYRHPGGGPRDTRPALRDAADVPRFQWSTTVGLAGRRWQLQFTPTLAYLAVQQTWPLWVMLTGGFLFTGLLGAFLLVVTGHTARVEQLVVERTTELAHTNAALAREQEALRQQREWLAVTLASIRDAVLATDTHGTITFCNPAAEALTGWTARDALGRPVAAVFRCLHQPTRQPVESPVARVLHDTRPGDGTPQTALLTRQGDELAIAYSSAPIRDRAGQLQGVVVVFRDISEQRREEWLRAQKVEAVGVLAGGLAHDFNNLLTGILGNISLAKTFAGAEARVVQRLSEAEKACQRATALTQQLLTFAKGGAPVRQTVAIAELLRESSVFALRGTNVRVDVAIAEGLWPVDADGGQLSQVLQNVVLNAAQAMPGGGTVQVRAANTVLHPGGPLPLPAGRYLHIAVTDQGCGIPAALLPQIFDPYFTTKAHGSGLGLATAYAIVTKHEGYITAASEVGVGTTFSLYLPASPHPVPPRQEVPVPLSGGGGRVLVMDDEDAIRELLGVTLTELGYAVVCTRDGAEAIAAYQRAHATGQPFTAVLLDITVPGGLGGKDTIAQLRTLDPQVKALISSGYAPDPILANFAQYGFRGVVTKPYTVERLHQALQGVIRERQD